MAVSIEGQIVFAGPADAARMAGIMRAALARLVAGGMRYFRETEHDLHDAPADADARLGGRAVLLRDDRSSRLMMLEPRHAPKERYHFITVLWGTDLAEADLPTEWPRLCLRLGQVIEAVPPTAAIAWGRPADSDAQPHSAKLALGEPPFDIGPWTYLSNNLLNEATARLLAKLPDICRPTAAGTIITPAPLPGAPIAKGVSRAFAESSTLRLFDPMAKQDRPRRR